MRSHGTAEPAGAGEGGREQMELWERPDREGEESSTRGASSRGRWVTARWIDPAQLALEVESGEGGVERGRGPRS